VKHKYILYDGDCGFCNRTVMFIAKKDTKNNFKFVSNLSEFGNDLLIKYKIQGLENSTIILLQNEMDIYIKSRAIKKILITFPFYSVFGYLMYLIPVSVSDLLYDIVSKYRKHFIKKNNCEIPNLEIKNKFIL